MLKINKFILEFFGLLLYLRDLLFVVVLLYSIVSGGGRRRSINSLTSINTIRVQLLKNYSFGILPVRSTFSATSYSNMQMVGKYSLASSVRHQLKYYTS